MRVAVKDACILIDLANGGLLEAWFQLGIETCTTDLVLRQVKADNQWQAVKAFVDAGLLLVHSLSGAELLKIQRDYGHLPVGVEDRTALYVAVKLKAILLTGDRRLRIEGMKQELEVRGLLWVLDELVARNVITPKLAAVKLTTIRASGAFLPTKECDERLKQWE
jgi:hypothetical protein